MPLKSRIKPINTIEGCSREMQTLYRKMRREEMGLDRGKSLVYVLKTISGLISDSELEKRIEVLEAESPTLRRQ